MRQVELKNKPKNEAGLSESLNVLRDYNPLSTDIFGHISAELAQNEIHVARKVKSKKAPEETLQSMPPMIAVNLDLSQLKLPPVPAQIAKQIQDPMAVIRALKSGLSEISEKLSRASG